MPIFKTSQRSKITVFTSSSLQIDGKRCAFLCSLSYCRKDIVSDLEKGYTIICDRYFASGVAFSAAKGLDMEWCLSPDRGLPSPDLICFLDLSEQEQMKRGGFGNERYEVSSFQTAVRQKFLELMDFLPALNWKRIDAAGSADEVYAVLQTEVLKTIEECKDKAIGVLYFSLLQKSIINK